jgi:hypothetical protein
MITHSLVACHSSLGVEHSLSKRKVVGSNPACGFGHLFALFFLGNANAPPFSPARCTKGQSSRVAARHGGT